MRRNELNDLLRTLLESGQRISDLNFTVGKPPQIETDGELRFPFVDPPLPELTPFMTECVALNLMAGRTHLLRELMATGSCDCSYTVPGLARFRANIFCTRGQYSVVLRKLATKVPTIHDLYLPPVFQNVAALQHGLVLITGASGMGKSTTQAALVHEINLNRPVHIVTLEDPIEFIHRHQIGTVNQRELGQDFDTFAGGLRAALRQAPKVVVVGEMRDRETMETALQAAETGHLVFGTLQTMGAGPTIHRVVGMFEPEEQGRIRSRLAEVLRFVVAQCLVPCVGGGRMAALEIMASTPRTRELILEGEREHKTFYQVLSEGGTRGMQTFDQHLTRLFDEDRISAETVKTFCSDRVATARAMEQVIQAKKNASKSQPQPSGDTPPEELKMDFTYGRPKRGK